MENLLNRALESGQESRDVSIESLGDGRDDVASLNPLILLRSIGLGLLSLGAC